MKNTILALLVLGSFASGSTSGCGGGSGGGGGGGSGGAGSGGGSGASLLDGGQAGAGDAAGGGAGSRAPSLDSGPNDASDGGASDGSSDDGRGLSVASDGGLSVMLTIPATANLFGAGHAVPPDPSGQGPGTLPPMIQLPPGTGRTMTVTNVSGSIDFDGPAKPLPETGADGISASGLPAPPSGPAPGWDGIAGFVGPPCVSGACTGHIAFLAGVFLDAGEPKDPAPAPYTVDFAATVVDGIALRQSLFIGDGLNVSLDGVPVVQRFRIPDGATRVFFGFFDSYGPDGPLGSYDDNTGQIQATVTISR